MARLSIEARRARVAELRQQGLSFRAIGRELGVSHEIARRDARALGLPPTLTSVPEGLGGRGQSFYDLARSTWELDRPETELLNQICRLLDRADELRTEIARRGILVTTSQGNIKTNPACGEERQVSLTLGRLLAQLALPDEDAGCWRARSR